MLPPIVALCGHPGSGKSEVQRILHERYGAIPVDDGGPLREIAMHQFGLDRADVYTQAGKARSSTIVDRDWVHRDVLGQLGNVLEGVFGEHAMPWLATRQLRPGHKYSFGSVRRRQAAFYKAQGGFCIGIERPGVAPSPYDFDWFDPGQVDAWIVNDGNLADLVLKVDDIVLRIPEIRAAAVHSAA
jgi:hypothetical protein